MPGAIDAALETLKRYWGYETFRPGQDRMVQAILSGRDALGVMPTGAGKSICYQVPALALPGLTLVISPLVSLMCDQVRALKAAGARPSYLNSSLTPAQQNTVLKRASEGWYQIMYVAPERLEDPRFLAFAQAAAAPGGLGIPLIAVDEAHCVSQWGQDFRPSYLQISQFIDALPTRPVLAAFTATATERVRADIVAMLGLRDPETTITGFDRANLYFGVEEMGEKAKVRWILDYVREHAEESGIIYCATRKAVDQLSQELSFELMPQGISVGRYHAGMGDADRRESQEAFIDDRVPIMVATNAFGMGIDKPNVRFVIHYNMPKDLESYYQEAGRAGRDGLPSRCILLYSGTDVRTIRFFIDKEMEADNGLPADVKAEAARKAEERLRYMTFYSTTQKCLRRFMLNYFGEAAPEKCGNCSCCLFAEQNAQEVEQRAAAAKQRAAANSRRLSARRAAAGGDLSEADEKLLAALYALRKRLAAKQNVPAYMVFSDATLREMVQSKPLSMDEFLNITGVGEKKAARYGMAFLRAIEDMVGSRE